MNARAQLLMELCETLTPRQILLTPSAWAVTHVHLSDGPLAFGDYPYQPAMLDDMAPRIVVQKGSQVGISLLATARAFWALDHLKINVLYVFPTQHDASDYSSFRFDSLRETSPYLQRLFAGREAVKNVGHKRAGAVSLWLRGSNSRSQLKTIDPSMLVLDEFDEMSMERVDLARERLTGHVQKWELDISTPTIPDFGISEEFQHSDARYWMVPCPACNRQQRLTFDDNVEWVDDDANTARFHCKHCKAPWQEHERRHAIRQGEWVRTNSSGVLPGYHISQLYSPTMTAAEIVEAYLKVERSGNEGKRQVFYNSKLGEPYIAANAQITEQMVKDRMILPCPILGSRGGLMGVDITPGGEHYAVLGELRQGHLVILNLCRPTWEELPGLMHQYRVTCCVVDMHPEKSKAREFVVGYKGRAYMAFYPEGMTQLWEPREEHQSLRVDRTESLDRTVGRYRVGAVDLPRMGTHPMLEEFARHIASAVKSYELNKRTGEPVARYIDTGKPDHWLHANNYLEIASLIAPYEAGSSPIRVRQAGSFV